MGVPVQVCHQYKHPQDPTADCYKRVSGSKLQVALWLIYTLLLWILKAAMCVFYIRLTDGLDYSRRINFGFIFIICSWITVVFVILLGCFPLHQNWQIYPNPGSKLEFSRVSQDQD